MKSVSSTPSTTIKAMAPSRHAIIASAVVTLKRTLAQWYVLEGLPLFLGLERLHAMFDGVEYYDAALAHLDTVIPPNGVPRTCSCNALQPREFV